MRTPISYYGGKQTMLKHILPLIPSHKIYTEAFCGGAAVLFAKRPAEAEIINDINMELTNFYWCAQVYYSDLKCEIDKTLHSRDLHAHAGHINSYPQFFTPVERAWAVWALCKMSFASMMDGTFGYDFGGMMPKKLRNAKDEFTEQLCQRLERVTIENRNALDVIACYDAPRCLPFRRSALCELRLRPLRGYVQPSRIWSSFRNCSKPSRESSCSRCSRSI